MPQPLTYLRETASQTAGPYVHIGLAPKQAEALTGLEQRISRGSFYVALDDIEYTKWNCEKDKAAFGPSGSARLACASRLCGGAGV